MHYEQIDEDRVKLSTADAMEFLYKYTWGPESFPYEIREQYGVLPYDEYREKILGWLPNARWVELPAAQASYLQPGYKEHLDAKVEVYDSGNRRCELPDSNALLVFEKP